MINSYAAAVAFALLAAWTLACGVADWLPGFVLGGALMVVAAVFACTERD